MHREDESNYLLYVEPPKEAKSKKPNTDNLLVCLEMAYNKCIAGTSCYSDLEDDGTFNEGFGFKGFHRSDDGEISTGKDYLLPNGMITNSLAIHYVKWYRDWLPDSEIKKLKKLQSFFEK